MAETATRTDLAESAPPRPNIVVMHCHDLGRLLGCYGNPTVHTPHLDAFAADGIRFDGMFAAAPQCSPSRAALFTGRWPHANGVLGLTHNEFAWDLHPGERHLGGILREAGYRSVLLGVHHESRTLPDQEIAEQLGFDLVDKSEVLADPVADRGIAHLSELAAGEKPFFLELGFFEPHRIPGRRDPHGVQGFLGNHVEPDDSRGVAVPPYLLDTEAARTELAELQGAVRHMDAAAGRVLAHLDELGIADNTLVIFTTDHGLALPRAKCSLYDPGLEVAFIARYPRRGWTGGRVHDELLSHTDFVPTLLELLQRPADDDLHGRSFLPLLDGGQPYTPHAEVYGEMTYHDYYDPRRCLRTRTHKLIANFSSAHAFMDPSQSWHRRCIPRVQIAGPKSSHAALELYDLRADPAELNDLAGDPEQAELLADLSRRLYAWLRRTEDPLLHGAITSPLHIKTAGLLGGVADD